MVGGGGRRPWGLVGRTLPLHLSNVSNHGCSSVSKFMHALPSYLTRVESQAVLVPDQALGALAREALLALRSDPLHAAVSSHTLLQPATHQGGIIALLFHLRIERQGRRWVKQKLELD
jgi:hemin uptake protein HemP